METLGAITLTAWAMVWFFVCLFIGGIIFTAVAILIVLENASKFVGRKFWRLT